MRILAIDYGDRRIGLAMSDPMNIIASSLPVIEVKSLSKTLNHIKSIVLENDVKTIVIGLPINMDGSLGERAEKTRIFADELKNECDNINIVFKDERLSSVSANRVLDEAEVHYKKRKNIVDGIAAQIILQTYLESLR